MGTINSNILLESGTNEVEILEVYIDEEDYRGYYGVNVAKVMEIIPMPAKVMRPPHLRGAFAIGMFNHREKIIAIIDLSLWLGRKRVENSTPKVLITEFNKTVTAFLVSGVTRIHRVTWGDIRPLEGYMDNISDNVTSVVELEGRLVFLLDLEKAISDLNPDLAISTFSPDSQNVASFKESPIKVLHADDSGVIRTTLKKRLEEAQIFSVHSVNSGDEAWAYLVDLKNQSRESGRPLEDSVEAILTDIEMPGMDGYHLCKRIKDDPELKNMPVILFSSLINDKLLHKGEAVGADGQFAKPDLDLVKFIQRLAEEKRKEAK